MATNPFRMIPESFKIGAHPAITRLYFEDDRGRVWQMVIDVRGDKKKPEVSLNTLDVEDVPANWRDLTADELHLEIAKRFLDELIAMGKEDEDGRTGL